MPAKPFEAASTTRERPQPASAPFGVGDPGHRERRFLGGAGAFDQDFGGRLLGVGHVERRPVMGDLAGLGDAAKRVLGHGARHLDRALDKLAQRFRRAVARRHHRLLAADKHAQPEILALGAFELFGLAEPPPMRQRDALEQDRVGGVGAGAARAADQILQQVDRISGVVVHHTSIQEFAFVQ